MEDQGAVALEERQRKHGRPADSGKEREKWREKRHGRNELLLAK